MAQKKKPSRIDYQDSVWIHQTLTGNTRSFDNIVLKYQDQIYNLILKTIRNRVDAEDLTQNVFFNAYTHLKKFKQESALTTWLYSIAINQIRNYWRRKKSKLTVAESDIELSDNKKVSHLYDCMDNDPEIASEELKGIIDDLISFLPPLQKKIFILHYIIGCSCEEISEIINTSTSNIKIQLFRGRKYLFTKFEKEYK